MAESISITIIPPAAPAIAITISKLGSPGLFNIPRGGLAGQVLVKLSDNDYDLAWADSGAAAGDSFTTDQRQTLRNILAAELNIEAVVATTPLTSNERESLRVIIAAYNGTDTVLSTGPFTTDEFTTLIQIISSFTQ